MKASVAQFTEAAAVGYRPRRLGHVNFFIADLDRSIAFYTRVCGFEITALERHIGAGFFSNGNTHHDIGVVEVRNYEERRLDPAGDVSDRVSTSIASALATFGVSADQIHADFAASRSASERTAHVSDPRAGQRR